jgi:hypothetical protein
VSRRWLNWKCGIALGAASEKVRVAAKCLEILPCAEELRHAALEVDAGTVVRYSRGE